MSNIYIGILRNEDPESGNKWALSCKKIGLKYKIIDITSSTWLEQIDKEDFNFFLLKPPGIFERYKKIYDERVYILSQVLNKAVYPSYNECYIYENKKLLSDYLKAKKIPHPITKLFYQKSEALKFLDIAQFPVVTKTTIGASGSGVKIIISKKRAINYVKKAFSKRGVKRRSGPNRAIGNPSKWTKKAINNPSLLFKKLKGYYNVYMEGEKNYVIFQEFIPHEFEWRIVKIGDSYFGHKKIKYKDKASGSKGIDYTTPSYDLLDFAKRICEGESFNFMAIDIFEHPNKGFLVNELQTLFGHVQDYILEFDKQPGRFKHDGYKWKFEPGNFNTNESYDLRLQTAIELYKNRNS